MRVSADFRAKWKHIVHWHPDILARHLLPLIENPLEAHRFGVALGNWIKQKVIS
jgi:hypothetical protein